jgi:hypothetical protein
MNVVRVCIGNEDISHTSISCCHEFDKFMIALDCLIDLGFQAAETEV